jgi:hypothetical protein
MSDQTYDINDDVKRDVLNATDLVALIGASTSLKKMGKSWKGLCPFHGEKSASFYVHPDKGFYYCFGCGAKGDAITFVRETERMDFPEAVAYLARLAGIALPVRRSGTRGRPRARLARLRGARGGGGVLPRGPRHASRRAGAPREARPLARGGRGLRLRRGGGLVGRAQGRPRRALHGGGARGRRPPPEEPRDGPRLRPFPQPPDVEIRDPRGEVLGFGARAFGDEQPKYLNSPETARFSKGKLLYGLDRARDVIPKRGRRPPRRGLLRPHRVRARGPRLGRRVDGHRAHARAGRPPVPPCGDGRRRVRRRRSRRRRVVQGFPAPSRARREREAPRAAGRARPRLLPRGARPRGVPGGGGGGEAASRRAPRRRSRRPEATPWSGPGSCAKRSRSSRRPRTRCSGTSS